MASAAMIVLPLVGGLAGLTAGEISRALACGGRPVPGRRWPDRLSWLLAGGGALTLAVWSRATNDILQNDILVAVAEVGLVGLLLLVLASDVRERAVYPAVAYPGIALVVAAAPLLGTSTLDAALGAAAFLAIFGALYIVARLRYGPGALGAGDVSAAALLGAVVGLSQLPLAITLISLIGGAIALVVALRARSMHATFPYAPVLCLAALVTKYSVS